MTYSELQELIDNSVETDEVIATIMENICGDGYNAYARAYNIIKAIYGLNWGEK